MKKYIEKLIRACGYDIRKIHKNYGKVINTYIQGGRVPWQTGYNEYKEHYIVKQLTDKSVMQSFFDGASLPEKYGMGLDERCVEYPWLFSHFKNIAEKILDAGSVLNFSYLLESEQLKQKNVTIMTLAPEQNCFWNKGVSYHYGDLACTPFKNNCFDKIVCLSTLEHIGMDNRIYTKDEQSLINAEAYQTALLELKRILKPGGSIYLSVPYGKHRDYEYFQQFDRGMVEKIVDVFQPKSVISKIYAYSPDGWQVSDLDSSKDMEYSEYALSLMRKELPANLDDDGAAAARAVACLLLEKDH